MPLPSGDVECATSLCWIPRCMAAGWVLACPFRRMLERKVHGELPSLPRPDDNHLNIDAYRFSRQLHLKCAVVIFNRTYHTRARRGGLVSAGAILEELIERAADRQRFYRPARRLKPGAKAKQPMQLELDFEPVARDPERPLFDLVPEAYD